MQDPFLFEINESHFEIGIYDKQCTYFVSFMTFDHMDIILMFKGG